MIRIHQKRRKTCHHDSDSEPAVSARHGIAVSVRRLWRAAIRSAASAWAAATRLCGTPSLFFRSKPLRFVLFQTARRGRPCHRPLSPALNYDMYSVLRTEFNVSYLRNESECLSELSSTPVDLFPPAHLVSTKHLVQLPGVCAWCLGNAIHETIPHPERRYKAIAMAIASIICSNRYFTPVRRRNQYLRAFVAAPLRISVTRQGHKAFGNQLLFICYLPCLLPSA